MNTKLAHGATGFQSLLLGPIAVTLLGLQASSAIPNVWINEIHYDNASTDTGEFIEIAGEAGTDLTGFTLLLYNGSGGAFYGTTNLSGSIIDQKNGFGAVSFAFPVNGLQNGSPDGIALIGSGSFEPQFLSYEGSFEAADGPVSGITSTDIGVSETSSTPVGFSLQLAGSGSSYTDFTWSGPATDSPGSINDGQTLTPSSVPDSLPSSFVAAVFLGFMVFVRPRRAPGSPVDRFQS